MTIGEKIKFAHMHQSAFIPGMNKHVKGSLDPKELTGLEMVAGFAGVDCVLAGRRFTIPYVNFQSIVFETDLEKKIQEKESKKKEEKKKDA